ncbi:hypothetical protein ZIOFF_002233 [Zingiber officinale]|uniref:RRM domain-containing protein n=1 Tax=Zingiber officinale TaxID=94328 RepID=A0A8J5I739_ZINOF|nr:hypothetical protein ZIOFF_002233 [Zingiber officinale]
MRGRSYSYSPPPRGYGRRGRSPSPRGRYGGRGRDLPTSLLVRNLRRDCRAEDLRRPFGQFGPLKDIYLPRDYYTGEPRGFGFLQYVDPADAAEAKYHMDGQILLGRELTVVFAEENRKKPSEMRTREGRYTLINSYYFWVVCMITEGHHVALARLVIPAPVLAHLNILVLRMVGHALEAVAMNHAHLLLKGSTMPSLFLLKITSIAARNRIQELQPAADHEVGALRITRARPRAGKGPFLSASKADNVISAKLLISHVDCVESNLELLLWTVTANSCC